MKATSTIFYLPKMSSDLNFHAPWCKRFGSQQVAPQRYEKQPCALNPCPQQGTGYTGSEGICCGEYEYNARTGELPSAFINTTLSMPEAKSFRGKGERWVQSFLRTLHRLFHVGQCSCVRKIRVQFLFFFFLAFFRKWYSCH